MRWFIVAVCLFTQITQADTAPVTQLEAFLKASTTVSANFKQVILNEQGEVTQTSYGILQLHRPGKFYWHYQRPFEQKIIANGGKVWLYDTDLEQVTVKKLDKSLGATPALLLSGQITLRDNFNLEQQGVTEGLQWVRLQPKNPESSFKYIMIGLDQGRLGGMELKDNFDQLTRIYFSDLKINKPVADELFNFSAPKGVDVFVEE